MKWEQTVMDLALLERWQPSELWAMECDDVVKWIEASDRVRPDRWKAA